MGGRDMAVDIVVAHPFQLSQQPVTVEKAGRFTAAQEHHKVARIEADPAFARSGWTFSPMGFHTFGGPGPAASRLWHTIVKRATTDLEGWEKIRAIQTMQQNLSLALMREVARQLLLQNRVQDLL